MRGGLRFTGAAPRRSSPAAPLVSIVTVVLNGAAHVEQAITSVLGQSYRNVEYIVVDGGSTDGTLGIVERYGDRLDCWVSEPDSGIYAAMNKGLGLAQGELVALLNADDFYEPDAVERVVASYAARRLPGIYYGDNLVLQEDLQIKYRRRATLRYWLGMTICHQAMFVHLDVYHRLGGYREDYRFAADYEFLLRAAKAAVPLVHVDGFLVTYRETGLTSRNYVASLAEARRANRQYFGVLSRRHAAYLASWAKTLALHGVQRVVGRLCGERVLDALRSLYLRKVLLDPADVIAVGAAASPNSAHLRTTRGEGSDARRRDLVDEER